MNINIEKIKKMSKKERLILFAKIGKEIPMGYVFDENQNEISFKDKMNFWRVSKYNHNQKILYKINSNGYWEIHEYDNEGRQISYETSLGYSKSYTYDNGIKIFK